MRKLLRHKQASLSILGVVVVILSIMFATIIGGIVLFSFADAGKDVQRKTELFTIPADDEPTWCILAHTPDAVPNFSVQKYNESGTGSWKTVTYTNPTPRNITVAATQYSETDFENGTTIRVIYNAVGYSSVAQVGVYAIIVFTMLAIVPLIVVGGVMLRSLGFFSGGGGKP